MVRAVKGVLLECDEAVKQIILDLDANLHFVLSDLDETHLFIGNTEKTDGSLLDKVRKELDAILEENTYKIMDY